MPEDDTVHVAPDSHVDLRVVIPGDQDCTITWQRADQPVIGGTGYHYIPFGTSTDTIRCTVDSDTHHVVHEWRIIVDFPEPPLATFAPEDSALVTIQDYVIEFQAVSNRISEVTSYAWYRNGVAVGDKPTLSYVADDDQTDTVIARVAVDGVEFVKTWTIQMGSLEDFPVPVVQNIMLSAGSNAGEVQVFWSGVGDDIVPLREYRVFISYDGAITNENLDQAELLDVVPNQPGLVSYCHTYDFFEHELRVGTFAWFTVVAVAEAGHCSLVAPPRVFNIPNVWQIQGRVTDVFGQPLAGVTVRAPDFRLEAVTGAGGEYTIGAFPDFGLVTLVTDTPNENGGDEPITSWHDAFSKELVFEGDRSWDFRLIPRYGTDEDCDEYHGNFLTYLRSMTMTLYPMLNRPNLNLYRWENLPVPVYVPAHTSALGVDMAAAARQALAIWNQLTGLELFVESPVVPNVGLVFEFGDDADDRYGLALLDEPGGGAYTLGEVVPEKARILVYDCVPDPVTATETILHELGHVIGLRSHSTCNDVGYLMYYFPTGTLAGGPENAIHRDELRAVRVINALPQGQDMGTFIIQ